MKLMLRVTPVKVVLLFTYCYNIESIITFLFFVFLYSSSSFSTSLLLVPIVIQVSLIASKEPCFASATDSS